MLVISDHSKVILNSIHDIQSLFVFDGSSWGLLRGKASVVSVDLQDG